MLQSLKSRIKHMVDDGPVLRDIPIIAMLLFFAIAIVLGEIGCLIWFLAIPILVFIQGTAILFQLIPCVILLSILTAIIVTVWMEAITILD